MLPPLHKGGILAPPLAQGGARGGYTRVKYQGMREQQEERMTLRCVLTAMGICSWLGQWSHGNAYEAHDRDSAWRTALVADFQSGPLQAVAKVRQVYPADRLSLDVVADWIAQDNVDSAKGVSGEVIESVLRSSGPAAQPYRERLSALRDAGTTRDDRRWAQLYLDACFQRRLARLQRYREQLGRVVFTKHYDLGGSHYAYTEGQSDAQNEQHFVPGSSLCLCEVNDGQVTERTLLDDRGGVIRDPDTSADGKRILFSWKKSLTEDDYHLYELTVDDGRMRQLTSGLGFADYEGAYLPGGDIVFNSTRCVQTVDCWWTEVSNLFTCDCDGRHLRQMTFDQVHTNYPTVSQDGRVLYTRWDYNDRGQIYPQGLFQMNPDGTGQSELYGNNSWFPTSVLHAREFPVRAKSSAFSVGITRCSKVGWEFSIRVRGLRKTKGRNSSPRSAIHRLFAWICTDSPATSFNILTHWRKTRIW